MSRATPVTACAPIAGPGGAPKGGRTFRISPKPSAETAGSGAGYHRAQPDSPSAGGDREAGDARARRGWWRTTDTGTRLMKSRRCSQRSARSTGHRPGCSPASQVERTEEHRTASSGRVSPRHTADRRQSAHLPRPVATKSSADSAGPVASRRAPAHPATSPPDHSVLDRFELHRRQRNVDRSRGGPQYRDRVLLGIQQ